MLHCNVTGGKVRFSSDCNKGWRYTHFDQKVKRNAKEYEVKDKKFFFLWL